MKIDIFTHIKPKKYDQAMHQRIKTTGIGAIESKDRGPAADMGRPMWDMDFRFSIMDKYEGLVQVITPTYFPVELIAGPEDAYYLAKVYNDEMAELCVKYPDRFIGAVACLPMNNIDAALDEIDRAIKELGFRGILITTPICDRNAENRKSIDSAEIMPIYEKMVKYDLPVWLHPRREASVPDYTNEIRSMYGISHVLGWPYETSVAMSRLVFSGILEKLPNLKIITHHCGGMIPYFADRIVGSYQYWDKASEACFTVKLTKPPIEYFRMFYNDTAISGNTPALMCGYAFAGVKHIVFGTDFPYDAEFGNQYTRDTIAAVEGMNISAADKQSIYELNARKLLKI